MKTRTPFAVILLGTTVLVAPAALAQPAPGAPVVAPRAAGAPAAAAAPEASPAPAADMPSGVTARALPDRAASSSFEGLEPEPNGLTAAEVARRALVASANLKEKRAELVAADEKITQTMVQFFPKLTLSANYTRLSPVDVNFGSGALVGAQNAGPLVTGPCPNDPATTCVLDSQQQPVGATPFSIKQVKDNYALVGRLSVPISDYVLRLSDAAASSKAGKEAARLNTEAEKLKVEADAKALYFNWLRARASRAIADKAVLRTKARLSDAQAAFTVGSISKGELLRIEALVANTELVATGAESMVALTTGQLAIVMEDPHPAYRVGEGVPEPSAVPDAPGSIEQLTSDALSRRLEVQAVDESVRALRRGAGATRGGALPRVEAFGDVTYANPNPRYFPPQAEWHATWSVGVQASWTVFDSLIQSAAARELEANADAMQARRIAIRAGISQEVLSSYLDLTRARAALDKQRAALAAAEEAYRVTTDLFRAGRATGTDLIDSETELLDAKIADVNARIDLTVASIALRHASAGDVPASRAN